MSNGQIDATKSWQLAQAQTMIDLFTAARGRAPNTKDELGQRCRSASRRPNPAVHRGPTESRKEWPTSLRLGVGGVPPTPCQNHSL